MNKFLTKKIIDSYDDIVGYYSKKKIYLINTKKEKTIVDNKIYEDNKETGYIDEKDVYDNGVYIGKIKSSNKLLVLFLLLIVVLIVTLGLTYSVPNLLTKKSKQYQTIEINKHEGLWNAEVIVDLLYNEYAGRDENGNNLIAPGSQSIYKFALDNKNNEDYNCVLEFGEENEISLPIKYRLKLNDSYISGDKTDKWVNINQIGEQELNISSNNKEYFELEWKWDEESNDSYDTKYGIDGNFVYKIRIILNELENEK